MVTMRTIYSYLCGLLILMAALFPVALLLLDKAGM